MALRWPIRQFRRHWTVSLCIAIAGAILLLCQDSVTLRSTNTIGPFPIVVDGDGESQVWSYLKSARERHSKRRRPGRGGLAAQGAKANITTNLREDRRYLTTMLGGGCVKLAAASQRIKRTLLIHLPGGTISSCVYAIVSMV
jgi:hypothetical protein